MTNNINIIFDFDGVILDSNNVKTIAFKNISKRFGVSKSIALVKYHIKNGGVSRFIKIKWFVELDEYDGMNRMIMVDKGLWSKFQMSKPNIIKSTLFNTRLKHTSIISICNCWSNMG